MNEDTHSPMNDAPEEKAPEAKEAVHARVLPIHLLGSQALRTVASPVSKIDDELRAFAETMVATMIHANGIGLAANQIGVPVRVMIIEDKANNRTWRLANPIEKERSGEFKIDEGCLSQPMLSVPMKRPNILIVEAIDILTGQPVIVEGSGLEAAILAHELDHLDGKLLCDYISRLKRDFYKKKLAKKLKVYDRAQSVQVAKDHRDHPHHVEPKR